jgi:hypothetical protein
MPASRSTQTTDGADQAPGLQRVQAAQLLGRVPDPGDVEVLPADHPVDAGGAGQLARGEHERAVARLLAQKVVEGLGVEAVAGEDGDVLAELHVAGRAPAAQVVVVHGRQVVVDERVGVDELDGGGQRQHADGSRPMARAVASASTGRIRLPPASSE